MIGVLGSRPTDEVYVLTDFSPVLNREPICRVATGGAGLNVSYLGC